MKVLVVTTVGIDGRRDSKLLRQPHPARQDAERSRPNHQGRSPAAALQNLVLSQDCAQFAMDDKQDLPGRSYARELQAIS